MLPHSNSGLKRSALYLSLALVTLVLSGCDSRLVAMFQALQQPARVEHLKPKIVSVRPHDTTAFTEGLVWDNGELYESVGQYGLSHLREVDPQSGKIVQQVDLPPQVFGEGLALVNGRLIQLTWREHVAYEYDEKKLSNEATVSYSGEGWGLCYDGTALYMSDGSPTIQEHDPLTFSVMQDIPVTLEGQPVNNVNELECVDGSIYANVWHTNNILRIDKLTGVVTAVIDASGLLTPLEITQAGSEGVLNGIAYDSQHHTFLITGKLWPHLFEVTFVPG